MLEDAKRVLKQDISETELANSIAKAAGVVARWKTTQLRERLSITLGDHR